MGCLSQISNMLSQFVDSIQIMLRSLTICQKVSVVFFAVPSEQKFELTEIYAKNHRATSNDTSSRNSNSNYGFLINLHLQEVIREWMRWRGGFRLQDHMAISRDLKE